MISNQHSSIEILEARIAPAATAAVVYPTIQEAEALPHGLGFVTVQVGTPVLVHAGQILTTGAGPESGTYLMFVQQGEALVFTTDLNNNGVVDPNEITGIAAGAGLRLISFVDIHGDIVTDLNANGTLSDSQHNAALSNSSLGGDGRVLLDNSISMIEFRSLLPSDLTPGENIGLRYAFTNYSLYGNIFAGGGFGSSDGGLIIDNSQAAAVAADLNATTPTFLTTSEPSIGGIFTGTAASGQFFSFGVSRGDDLHPSGNLATFVPPVGQSGGNILNVGATPTGTTVPTKFNIGIIHAGDGGIGAAGGSIINTTINGSDAYGYQLIAGNGGNGPVGGAGGSIVNFSDLGSVTGMVTVQSGNGGVGTTGVGGAGGTVTLGQALISAGLTIQLGNGGGGFTAGGAGASLPSGSITPPDFAIAPNATFVTTTMHSPGSIGTTIPIDFNGDGFGDLIYGTQNPDTLVVLLGNGTGGFSQRIVLPMPSTDIDAVTVGDFLGNGHLDIAAVSGDTGANPGVVVFLSNYSKTGQFLGFDGPRWSPLPDLFSGDPKQGGTAYNFLHANAPGTQIVSGDFSGSGRTELAVSATYYNLSSTNQLLLSQLVVFMIPDLVDGAPDGQFYANFGTTAVAVPAKPGHALRPFGVISAGTSAAYLEATALSVTSTHDVVVGDNTGLTGDHTNWLDVFDNSNPSIFGPSDSTAVALMVDTNRNLGANMISLTPAFVGPFTILDFGGGPNSTPDGNADIAVLTSSPAGYMVGLEGNGANNWTVVSGNLQQGGNGDNQGTYFAANGYGIPGTKQVAIRAVNLDGSARYDDVAILDYDYLNIVVVFGFAPVDQGSINYIAKNPGSFALPANYTSDFLQAQVATIKAFDAYTPLLSAPNAVDMAVALPTTNLPTVSFVSPVDLESIDILTNGLEVDSLTPEVTNFIHITAGDGGDALVGSGGVGGSLGGALTAKVLKSTQTSAGVAGATVTTTTSASDLVGQLSVTLPADLTFNGDIHFTAGSGGDGFTSGGSGGNIAGVSVAYGAGGQVGGAGLTGVVTTTITAFSPVTLIAGNGGSGVSGSGGNGGSLVSNAIDFGELFQAGDGGTGAFGGNGGSIVGSGKVGFYDTLDVNVTLLAGQGANGVKSGGNGGAITNFHPSFNFPNSGVAAGDFQAIAGNGGDASSGPGGNGGAITNISPLDTVSNSGNYMAGDVDIEGGAGGDGLSGGNGGGISNFSDSPSNDLTPALLSILGGNAGNGVSGAGGHGGGVSNVTVPSSGQPSGSAAVKQLTLYSYDRILAGNGGNSAGDIGGAGGDLSEIVSVNTAGGFAVLAGAGGSGLYAGGAGGSIVNDFLQLGGKGGGGGITNTKLLAIAGKGGDATAWIPDVFNTAVTDQSFKAFGGRVGHGGNGGNITDLTQSGGIFVNVDLIAGNGGDTVNYGTISDSQFFVGTGGSVSHVSVAGEIGNTDFTTPIKSYNDVVHGQTIANFVDVNFRDNPNPSGSVLDDSLGSVGIIVGAAGRLRSDFVGYDANNAPIYESEPATGGVNGSLISVHAYGGIESAVAGSVVRIATITVVQDVSVTINDIGVNKAGAPPAYLDPNGNPLATPVIGGSLIDGALIAKSAPTALVDGVEVQVTLIGNVFVLD